MPIRPISATIVALFICVASHAQESSPAPDRANLAEAQQKELAALKSAAEAKAAGAALALARAAREFNANLLSETPDPALDAELSRKMIDALSTAIQLRIERIRASAKLLTPEQRAAIRSELQKADGPFLFDDLLNKLQQSGPK